MEVGPFLSHEKSRHLEAIPDQPPEAQIAKSSTLARVCCFGPDLDFDGHPSDPDRGPLKLAHYIGLKWRPQQIGTFGWRVGTPLGAFAGQLPA
jgi:hypothetical protein